MTRIEFWSAVTGLLVAIVMMFNQVNGRIDRMQAETNARFDAQQAETNRRFDQMFDRLDRMQTENSRQHDDLNRRFDTVLETIMSFDRRVSRLEGRLDIQGAGAAE